MLEKIRAMIKSQQAQLEAADLLFGKDDELDDSLVLGIYSEADEGGTTEDPTPVGDESSEEKPGEDLELPEENSEETPTEEPTDPMDTPTEDEPLPLPGSSDLPEPVGRQTGEPAQLAAADLLDIEIDMATNTPTSTLPIPPAGANDAVVSDDLLDQRVDSGFGGNEDEKDATPASVPEPEQSEGDIFDAPVEDNDELESVPTDDPNSDHQYRESHCDKKCDDDCDDEKCNDKDKKCDNDKEHGEDHDHPMSEAISVGNAAPAEGDNIGADTPPAEVDDTTDPGDTADGAVDDTPAEEDNTVTAAVKDKVAEMDAEGPTAPVDNPKEALFKKLSNLTKGLEDVKKAVMDSMD